MSETGTIEAAPVGETAEEAGIRSGLVARTSRAQAEKYGLSDWSDWTDIQDPTDFKVVASAYGQSEQTNFRYGRIFAAAPEMLAALQLFLDEHDNTYDGEPLSMEMSMFIDKARAAVAKAVGQ